MIGVRVWLLTSGGGDIHQWDRNGETRVFRPQAGSNGLLFDHGGRLLVCENVRRRVTRTELDGTVTVLTDQYEGKRYNQPNDLTIDSQGRIYFSDPRYGNRAGMEIIQEGKEVEGVYRIDSDGTVTRVITHEVDRPNGVLVSADDRYLFVADNNNNDVGGARRLWRFDLNADGEVDLESQQRLFDWGNGRGPDGMVQDQAGRLYVAGGRNEERLPAETTEREGGIYVLTSEGRLLDFIPIPNDEVTNCTFGGDDLRTLFVTAGGELWTVRTRTPGRLPWPKVSH